MTMKEVQIATVTTAANRPTALGDRRGVTGGEAEEEKDMLGLSA
jgi:hypothetical protein